MAGKRYLSDEDAILNNVLCDYRRAARRRKIPFELSLTDARRLFLRPCQYCGQVDVRCTTPSRYRNKFCVPCNGLDRVRNDLGYVEGNVVPCCKTCNRSKSNLTLQGWIAWVAALVSRQILQQYEERAACNTQTITPSKP